MDIVFKTHPNGISFTVHLSPRAKRLSVKGVSQGMLLVGVTAAPEDGKANEALITFLSEIFQVKKSSISLLQGLTNRKKVVFLSAFTEQIFKQKMAEILELRSKP